MILNWLLKSNRVANRGNPQPQDIHIRSGHLSIPKSWDEIPAWKFDGNKEIKSVTVPGTVKTIGERAFANCKNLTSVKIHEGVESINSVAFTGCEQLKSVRLPHSIKEIDGWAFYGTGLTRPVYSTDGRRLIYFPQTFTEQEYTIPKGIEEIGSCAFIDMKQLTQIHLPISLKRIKNRAFLNCGFREVYIPAGVIIEHAAFSHMGNDVVIHFEESQTPFKNKLNECNALGKSFLTICEFQLPTDKYWKQADFQNLAKRCAAGDSDAMDEMGDYFSARADSEADEVDKLFYQRAKHFWRMRAYQYGSHTAEQYLERWAIEHPGARMESPDLDEHLFGRLDGENLNALGFLFFDSNKGCYNLEGMDEQSVVEVALYSSEDGPDEDGFGAETYFDWWYLDDCLNLPEGISGLYDYSPLDKENHEDKFRRVHDQVAEVVKQRNTEE